MHVIAFASQKGGSGKTTLAGHIAVEAERQGAGPVALIDTDPQGSLSQWWNAREAERPFFARASNRGLEEDLATLRDGGVRLVVIDTPPAITATIGHVIGLADLVVIPTRPSPHDLRAAGATVRLCEEVGKPLVFAVNGASPRIDGRTVMEIGSQTKSPEEVGELWRFLDDRLKGRETAPLASATFLTGSSAERDLRGAA